MNTATIVLGGVLIGSGIGAMAIPSEGWGVLMFLIGALLVTFEAEDKE